MGRDIHYPEAFAWMLAWKPEHPDWSAEDYEREMKADPHLEGDLPGVDTIRRYQTRMSSPDLGDAVRGFTLDAVIEGRWSVSDAGSESSPAVLAALAAAIVQTGGQRSFLTRAEAGWVARLSRLAPDAPAGDLYRIARAYLLCDRVGQSTESLDQLLAFAPWRDGGKRYAAAIASGAVRVAHRLVLGSEDEIDRVTVGGRPGRVKQPKPMLAAESSRRRAPSTGAG